MRRLILIATLALTAVLGSATMTVATNTDGAAALASCNFANNRSGGVELFSLENQSGGSRVWCVTVHDTDTNFGGFPSNTYDSDTGDVGSFNDKTDSLRLRVNPGCAVIILFWTGTGASGPSYDGFYRTNTGSTVQTYDFNISNNIVSSGEIEAFDAPGRRCEGLYI